VIARLAARMHDDKAQVIRGNTCLEQGKILGDRIGFAITATI